MSSPENRAARDMPTVDRVAANRAAIAARQARAELKRRLRSGEVSPLRVLEQADEAGSPAATLRITDFLLSFPAIGVVKAERVREQLDISERKRLGGLGVLQRERLERFVRERTGATERSGRPPLTVLAGPTAVGKGTVAAYIREHYPEVRLSVSATTRAPRPGEVEGEHYFFVTDEGFDRMLAAGELLEWATVHNKYRYGTPRGPVLAAAEAGELMLLEIDLQGARQVRASMPEACLVFLAPPSWEELVNRLVGRGTEDSEERARRLETAKVELAAAEEFDEVIVNDEVPLAAARLVEIMRGGVSAPSGESPRA
ncbi:guanylate kinase [Leucobacter chromiireducens]|uniref:Guanylate kinase n=1 Tax=Leucobacter chromiireducens subsp. solipictus TaxID=398235 RepID=A0ABS1SGJ3_9MICO|nr:guanylate kinase [Leucobacter chromiireducens]MBL3679447.1 guanylate kinase [Leucobacter chromiireducens subsp. solipictus]